jgi:hypothetical protein
MSHHIMPHYLSLLKIILKIQEKSPHAKSHFSIKNNLKNFRNMCYNLLKVINGEFSQHASMPRHLSPMKNSFENSRIFFSKLVAQL